MVEPAPTPDSAPADDIASQRVRGARVRVALLVSLVIAGLLLARWTGDLGWQAGEHAGTLRACAWGGAALLALLAGVLVRAGRASRRGPVVLLAVAVLLACTAWGWTRLYTRPSDALTRVVLGPDAEHAPRAGASVASPIVLTVEGLATSVARPTLRGQGPLDRFLIREPGQHLELRVRAARTATTSGASAWQPASGTLRVLVAGEGALAVRPGQALRATGTYVAPAPPLNPGEADERLRARVDGDVGLLRLSGPALLMPAEHIEPTSLDALLGSMRDGLARARARALMIIDRASLHADPRTHDEHRALLRGLMLGERDGAGRELSDAFARLGLVHVLSISGFHLTVMALVTLWLLRLTGDRGWLEPAIVAALVVLYTLIVPANAPIQRSALMVLALLLAQCAGRRYDGVCVLGWIALGLLLWRPIELWSLGFQLSLGLTAMLVWATPHATAQLLGGPSLRGVVEQRPAPWVIVLNALRTALGAATMCWLVSLPVVALHAGVVSPLGAIATLIVSPIIVGMLWVGYATLLLGAALPIVADASGVVLAWLGTLAVRAVEMLDALPGSSLVAPVLPAWWALLATALFAGWARWGGVRVRAWGGAWWAGLAIVVLALVLIISRGQRLPQGQALRVDMLAVGDGTCMLLRAGDEAILWDAQPTRARGVQPGVVMALRALGVARVPRVVISHPDIDHFAGLPELVHPLGVREVLVGERFLAQAKQQQGGAAATLLEELARRDVVVRSLRAGDELRIGPASARVLAPAVGFAAPTDNDHSLVLWVHAPRAADVGPAGVLLTGDAGPAAIAALRTLDVPRPDAMELPHHGSVNEQSLAWIDELRPRVVLQSTGPRRLDAQAWQALRDRTEAWAITARDGWTGVVLRDDGSMRIEHLPVRSGVERSVRD